VKARPVHRAVGRLFNCARALVSMANSSCCREAGRSPCAGQAAGHGRGRRSIGARVEWRVWSGEAGWA